MTEKLQIFFQPSGCNSQWLRSFTLIWDRFSKDENMYRRKTILEIKQSDPQKEKVFLYDLKEIAEKLQSIPLPEIEAETTDDDDLYYIQIDSYSFKTNNKEDIIDLLRVVEFDELLSDAVEKYMTKN